MKKHLLTVDVLRGIAALFVLLFHFTGTGMPKLMEERVHEHMMWGRFGVEIFFVISGFIIPYVLYQSGYTIQTFGKFIGKRFTRICPPSYILLMLTLVQYYFIDRFHLSQNPWFGKISTAQVLNNLTYTIPFTSYTWINGIFWTLAIEFQFYLFLGLVFNFMYRGLKEFIFFSLALSSLYYTPLVHTVGFVEYSSLFIVGGITFLFFTEKIQRAAYFAVLAAAGIMCFFQVGCLQAVFGICTSLIISFATIENKVGLFFGRISYSLYLTHILVGSSIEMVLVRALHPTTLPVKIVCWITAMGAAVLFAYIFYRIFEAYFIKLSGKLFSRKKLQPANELQKQQL